MAALACAACGAILPIQITHHADPGHAQVAVGAPAVELPADAHTHPERESGPVSEVTAQAGGGDIVSAGANLSGEGTLTAGGAISSLATLTGEGTLAVGGAVPTTTVLNGTGTLRAG